MTAEHNSLYPQICLPIDGHGVHGRPTLYHGENPSTGKILGTVPKAAPVSEVRLATRFITATPR